MNNMLGQLYDGDTRTAAVEQTEVQAGGGFAVLDFETTGLFPGSGDRVVELAVVHVDRHGVIEGRWETLINPGRDLGPQSIHHIQARDILDAPTFAEIAPQLVQLFSGRVLVAHNARFDARFLVSELDRIGYDPGVTVVMRRTMMVAATIIPGAGRSLADCCAHFDIEIDRAHCAGADAFATAQLLGAYIAASPDKSLWADAIADAKEPWAPITGGRAPWKARPAADHVPPHFLERVAVRLPEYPGLEAEQSYLALIDRVLIDHEISAHEAEDLVHLADTFELGQSSCERLHSAYFQALATIAWADNVLTGEEESDLTMVAELLRIPDADVAKVFLSPAAPIGSVADQVLTVPLEGFKLRAGDSVVLTGAMARSREEWAEELESHGLVWINCISKKVRLLVAADPDSLSGKAAKARDYGITIVSEDGLTRLLADIDTKWGLTA